MRLCTHHTRYVNLKSVLLTLLIVILVDDCCCCCSSNCCIKSSASNIKVSSVELLKREFGSFAIVVIIGNWRTVLIEDRLLVINAVVVVGTFVVVVNVLLTQKVVLESLK
uniref:Uncharacterized protein n=1 Tax=Glossina austeni TaxID=7395 RepID=A0A1A9V8C3_GLOAU